MTVRSFRYVIYNKYDEILDLSHGRYMPDLPSVQRSVSLIPRLEQGGSVLQGDGQVRNRKLNLSFSYVGRPDSGASSYEDVYTILNTLSGFFRIQDQPFYLHNLERDTRIRVFSDFSPSHMEGNEFLILKNSKFQIDLLDSAWEDATETETVQTELSTGQYIDLTLPSYTEDIYPVIELEAVSGTPTTFSVLTGRGTFTVFRYALITELTFSTGKIITMDSTTGKFYIDDNINQDMLVQGSPVKFDRRNTRLRWDSGSGSGTVLVKIRYRNRSLYG